MNHHNHPHILFLASPDSPFKCCECKELGFGRCYSCAPCDFYMHEECARPESYARHPFDDRCTLEYRARCKLKACDACGKSIGGSRYRNKIGWMSSLDFHPCCPKLRRTIDCEGIQLRLVDGVSSKCLKCGRKNVKIWGGRGWSYVSSCGQICYHVACVKEAVLESFDNGTLLGRRGRRSRAPVSGNYPTGQPQNLLVRSSRGSSTGRFIRKIVVKMVFKLIISAIFGDPTTVISEVVIESLCQSAN